MSNDLPYQLKINEALWKRWLEFGISSGAEFEIEFHFFAAKEDTADKLIDGFEKSGFAAEKKGRRSLLFFKDWHVKVLISQRWTLEALNDRTRQFCRLADMLHVVFDGCGAYMPSQEQQSQKCV